MTSSLVRRMMNRGIAKMNAFAVRQLELAPTDRVLEIGFGGWQLASSESGHP
jgi:protein-L-isoaspartate O-methyltransferase